jgi:hypothetical protein
MPRSTVQMDGHCKPARMCGASQPAMAAGALPIWGRWATTPFFPAKKNQGPELVSGIYVAMEDADVPAHTLPLLSELLLCS